MSFFGICSQDLTNAIKRTQEKTTLNFLLILVQHIVQGNNMNSVSLRSSRFQKKVCASWTVTCSLEFNIQLNKVEQISLFGLWFYVIKLLMARRLCLVVSLFLGGKFVGGKTPWWRGDR